VVILWENNYAALKIIDVDKFIFYFIKISFPFHFLFKWRQNLTARPRIIPLTQIYVNFKVARDAWNTLREPKLKE